MTAAVTDPLLGSQIRVDLQIAPDDIDLTVINGVHTGKLRATVFYADHAGNYLGEVWKTIELNLRDETYQRYLQSGIPVSITVPVKAPRQMIKVVVYDIGNDRLGSRLIKI